MPISRPDSLATPAPGRAAIAGTLRVAVAIALLVFAAPAAAQIAKVDFSRATEAVADMKAVLGELRKELAEQQRVISQRTSQAYRLRDENVPCDPPLVCPERGEDAFRAAMADVNAYRERTQKSLDERLKAAMDAFRPRLRAAVRELADEGGWELVVDARAAAAFLEKVHADDVTDALVARYDARYPVGTAAPAARPAPRAPRGALPAVMEVDLDRAYKLVAAWGELQARAKAELAAAQQEVDAAEAELREIRAALKDGSVPLTTLRQRLERRTNSDHYAEGDRDAVDALLRLAVIQDRTHVEQLQEDFDERYRSVVANHQAAVRAFAEQEAARRGAVLLPTASVLFRRAGDDSTSELVRLYDARHPSPSPQPARAR